MDNRPVGIFDSGLGGLTAVAEFKKLMPSETVIYFGDTGRCPYGARPASQIRDIARQNLNFVGSRGAKTMIAACGTISSNADEILHGSPIYTCGVLKPGVEELCATGCGTLGVIATATSIQSGAYQSEISARAPGAEVMAVACPEFVTMIESGHFDPSEKRVRDTVSKYLTPMKEAGVGALLLGCTHYGLIARAIDEFFDGRVALVSASAAAAGEMARYLEANGLAAHGSVGEDRFFTSGDAEEFKRLGKLFLGRDISDAVEFVPPFPA